MSCGVRFPTLFNSYVGIHEFAISAICSRALVIMMSGFAPLSICCMSDRSFSSVLSAMAVSSVPLVTYASSSMHVPTACCPLSTIMVRVPPMLHGMMLLERTLIPGIVMSIAIDLSGTT